MSIQKYSTSDYSSILDIYASAKLDELKYEQSRFTLLPLDKDETRFKQVFGSDIYLYHDNGAVGFGAHAGAEIRALFVHPEQRGKGIGRHLLDCLLSKISQPACLYVAASNYPAIELYQKYGFKTTAEFITSYNQTPVLANKMQQSPPELSKST